MASASTQQQQPMAQVIFDSLTRCFNPIDEESAFSNRCPRQSPVAQSPKTSRRESTGTSQGVDNKNKSRQSSSSGGGGSSSSSSDNNNNNVKAQYDADRYIHRKLEIFRTTEEDLAEMGIALPPKKRGHHRRGTGRSANTLVESSVASSDGDEIATLTSNHKRKEKEIRDGTTSPNNRNSNENYIATIVGFLKDPFSCVAEVQKPITVCFATPVRTSSPEDISKLSDWKLTAKEFAMRHQERVNKSFRCDEFSMVDDDAVPPEADESSVSLEGCDDHDEENTMTSASYFDQKYSHVVETNPPMPLFAGQRITVTENHTDEIFRLVKRREGQKGTPPRKPRSKSATANGKSTGDRSTKSAPADHVIMKKSSSAQQRATAHSYPCAKSKKLLSAAGGGGGSSKKTPSAKGHGNYDSAPMCKSSSVSTQNSDESHTAPQKQHRIRSSCDNNGGGNGNNKHQTRSRSRLREPDIVHSTAAGI
mmetsp:Transcript_3674/g.9315  ORF Transcript_3674/g.9315 Transcript_3674/m.9315 type:complete len:478 (+) Transcript_3674:138-1571(+)|eukprot:CAMPEP_0181088520 /NCGR_PEP_ID=MMETSP1071-20121207/6830_1 /TAXON_ID=35127 /ORGANISM="Thalassiosira sp., Strain NH16" /LENGTH=477 /DNA_ID=CAMNT_0023170441 /DNA_START=67 /DNA_END=1500 /DNA_ORIENTATION=+